MLVLLFAAEETLGGLKPGRYKFVVTNEAGKVVGFQVQHMESHKNLTSFPLEPGETKSATVRVTEAGIRYRCPCSIQGERRLPHLLVPSPYPKLAPPSLARLLDWPGQPCEISKSPTSRYC